MWRAAACGVMAVTLAGAGCRMTAPSPIEEAPLIEPRRVVIDPGTWREGERVEITNAGEMNLTVEQHGLTVRFAWDTAMVADVVEVAREVPRLAMLQVISDEVDHDGPFMAGERSVEPGAQLQVELLGAESGASASTVRVIDGAGEGSRRMASIWRQAASRRYERALSSQGWDVGNVHTVEASALGAGMALDFGDAPQSGDVVGELRVSYAGRGIVGERVVERFDFRGEMSLDAEARGGALNGPVEGSVWFEPGTLARGVDLVWTFDAQLSESIEITGSIEVVERRVPADD